MNGELPQQPHKINGSGEISTERACFPAHSRDPGHLEHFGMSDSIPGHRVMRKMPQQVAFITSTFKPLRHLGKYIWHRKGEEN